MTFVRFLLLGLLLAGCTEETPCSAKACPGGCCDAEGVCQLGTENFACGTAGLCSVCQGKETCYPNRTCDYELEPQLFLVVSTSASMNEQIDATCTAGCPTRMAATKLALEEFARDYGKRMWVSLATFPKAPVSGACGTGLDVLAPPQTDESDKESLMTAQATAAAVKFQTVTAAGGRTLADALDAVAKVPNLVVPHRKTYVVVISEDPNCNPSNPNGLDVERTALSVEALSKTGAIPVFVGFGHPASYVSNLTQVAKKSPYARSCYSDGECPFNPTPKCVDMKQCSDATFVVTSKNELSYALYQFVSKAAR